MEKLDNFIDILTDAQEAIELLDKLLNKWDWQKQEIIFEPIEGDLKSAYVEMQWDERRKIAEKIERYMDKKYGK